MNIKLITKFEQIEYKAIVELMKESFDIEHHVSEEYYRTIIESHHTHLLAITDGEQVVGTLLLVIYSTFTGQTKGYIEDVAVSSQYRGQGLGKKIVSFALDYTHSIGAVSITLTSSPNKIAANAMYRSLGFELRQTNVYYYNLDNK